MVEEQLQRTVHLVDDFFAAPQFIDGTIAVARSTQKSNVAAGFTLGFKRRETMFVFCDHLAERCPMVRSINFGFERAQCFQASLNCRGAGETLFPGAGAVFEQTPVAKDGR